MDSTLGLLEESWEEKFLAAAIDLQGSTASCETFFREKGDPEATTVASVTDTANLVKKVLRMKQLPPLEQVSEDVLKNTVAIEYLDLMAHTPWSTPLELVLSSDHVLAEAMAISALALFGFHFTAIKIPGKGKVRGVRYGPVLATIAKAANMNHALTSTSACAAASGGDLLELRWYARRAQARQAQLDGSRSRPRGLGFASVGRATLHCLDPKEGKTPLHHAASMGHTSAVSFLCAHWTVIHQGAPDELLNSYEDDEEKVHLAANGGGGGGSGGGGGGAGDHSPSSSSLASSATSSYSSSPGSGVKASAVGTGLDAGPDSNVVVRRLVNQRETRGGNGALSLAIQNGHSEVALLLLRKGANPNQQNYLGRTPLACAAAKGLEESLVTKLFDFGALATVKTNFGLSADQVAHKAGHKHLAKRIVELQKERRKAVVEEHRAHNDLEEITKY